MKNASTMPRTLTTILFSDIHGYSARMKHSENEMFDLLAIHNEVFTQAFRKHRGQVVKTIGDAFMAAFDAPSSALRCAVLVQQTIAELRSRIEHFDISVRIGIHVGEAIRSDGDLYGHCVNVAARTEPLATPGCVALTADVARCLQHPLIYALHDRGLKKAKNIGEIHVFEVDPESEALDPDITSIVTSALERVQRGESPAITPSSSASADRYASIDHALVRLGAGSYQVQREQISGLAAQMLMEGPLRVTALVGIPGIGKSMLMFDIARRLRSTFPFGLALSFDGKATLDSAYTLDDINTFLNSIGRGIDSQTLHIQDAEQALGRLVMRMADLQILVIMDAVDVLPTRWLTKLVNVFSSISNARVLMTARSLHIDRQLVRTFTVPPLAEPEVEQFCNEYSETFGLGTISKDMIARLPPEIRSHPQSLVALLMNLRDLPLSILLEGATWRGSNSADRLVKELIASLSMTDMNTLAFLCLLSELDLARTLAALSLNGPSGFLTSLQILLSRSLVLHAGSRYSVSAIVSACLLAVAPSVLADQRKSITSALKEALNSATDSHDLEALAGVVLRVSLVGDIKQAADLLAGHNVDIFLELLNRQGYWKEYCSLLRLALKAAEQSDDRAARIDLGFRLLRKLVQRRDSANGWTMLETIGTCIVMTEETKALADFHSHRALLYDAEHNDVAALRDLLESQRILSSKADDAGLLVVEKLLGNLFLRRKNYQDARAAFEKVITKTGPAEMSKHVIEAATSLALCDVADGQLEKAEARLREVLMACDNVRFEAGKPRALLTLAKVLEQRGCLVEAVKVAQTSVNAANGFDPPVAAVGRLMLTRMRQRQLAD